MSEKTKKSSKPQRNTTEKVYDWATSIPESKNPKNISFPEWVDDEINLVSQSLTSHSGRHKEKDKGEKLDKLEKGERSEEFFKKFEDPQVLFLPFSLQDLEHDWKRPADVFPDYRFVIYAESGDDYSDLLNSSAHVVQSAFMRSFISSVQNLEYLAHTTHFAQEAATSKYVPNVKGDWKPWHHVYGGSKVGFGTVHDPQVNAMGKYFVRLFWLGAWRKIIIDDFLPIDVTGHVLLPSLRIPKKPSSISVTGRLSTSVEVKEKDKQKGHKPEHETPMPTVVLWPFLLAKGLLKVANLTMSKHEDLLDFNIVHCLTGWVVQKLDLSDIPQEDMWEICKNYTKLYSWEDLEAKNSSSAVVVKQKKGKKEASKILVPATFEETDKSHYVMAVCKDMRSLKQSAVAGMSPCWGHEIVIDECRDLPLERPPPNPEYPLWKKFRWMEWAKSKGLIEDPVSMDTTRYLKCVSPFRKFIKQVVYKETSPEDKNPQFPLRKSLAILQKAQQPVNPEKKDPTVDDNAMMDLYRPQRSKEKKLDTEPPLDPSAWIPFEDLWPHLINIFVFYKPSTFYNKARVADVEMNSILETKGAKSISRVNVRGDGETWQDVTWPNTLEERGNIPLYFFIDSLESKMILVNLSQTGDPERLVPLENELSEHNFFVEYERLFGDRFKNQEEATLPPKKLKLNRARIHAGLKNSNVIFEKYRWNTAMTGKVEFFLNTYGNSSSMLELNPGRHVFRVWVKSEFSFCLTILADTRFSLGCFEQILEEMAEEPMRITQFTLNISDCFGRLVQSFGNPAFSEYLHAFYRSYLPKDADKVLTKLQKAVIHEVFQKSLLQYLQFSQDFFTLQKLVETLRTVFLDRNIRINKQSHPKILEPFVFQSLQEKIICERAATKLQSFFKGVQMERLLARHKPDNAFYAEVYDTLKQLYQDNFSLDKRDECLGSIIRNFFKNSSLTDFVAFYNVSKDFKWDVTVQTFSGTCELNRDYVILSRYVLKCHSEVMLAIHLFCSIPNYCLRIIDNDNGSELYRFTNQVFPMNYKPNNFGYTLVGFAWFQDVKLINWKLAVISSRTTNSAFQLEEIKTTTTTAFDHYVPICKDLIGKHSIFVRESVIFTFRFSCSFEHVKFNIKLFDPSHNLIVDMVGKEKIVLPAVFLKYSSSTDTHLHKSRSSRSVIAPRSSGRYNKTDNRKSMERVAGKKESVSARKVKDVVNADIASVTDFEPQVYNLEFYVVDKSWPLTKNEWEVVRRLREDMYFVNVNSGKDAELVIKESSSKSILKSAKDTRKSMLKKIQSIEKPWYLLQYSFRANAQVALIKDKTEEDKVYNLKKCWYQMDPDRYTRSFELRQNYLKKYSDPGCECPDEYLSPTPAVSMSRMTEMSLETNSNPLKEEDEETAERSTKCPRWTEANIPPFDLSPYFRPQCPCPLEYRRKTVKNQEDHIADRQERLQMIEDYNVSLAKKKHDMELWINDSNERRTLVFLWYADCRRASERIFQEALTMREQFFERWAAELAPPPKDEKKSAKGKK